MLCLVHQPFGMTSSTSDSCAAVPILLRPTTLAFLHPQVLRIAASNAARMKAEVYVSGCWSDTDLVGLRERVHSIGLSSHPACSAQWQKQWLYNAASTARLKRMQPIWAAVDVLTAHAAQRILRTTCRYRLGSARRGVGCTAFVVDVCAPRDRTLLSLSSARLANVADVVLMMRFRL